MLEYVAKFIELAHFTDDYMAKVWKFEDGLKFSIQDKIVGLLLQEMDSMVRRTMAIEREMDEVKSIRDAGVSGKRKKNQFSSGLGKRKRTSFPRGSLGQGRGYQGQSQVRATSQT